MAAIKLENVDFYYDRGQPAEVHALKDVNLSIETGDYTSFFGPSGCGKSTMLYVIAGVERPDTGKIFVNGRDLMEFSQKELAIYRQIGIGIIFQNFNLIPSIKIVENVTLPMAFLGISLEKRKERAMEILGRLGIADLAERYPYELSGGQQQRVGIARALANDPPIILADEPIGNLDSANAQNVLDLLKEFNEKDGKTIIMVTHEAWSLRDVRRIFYMKDGAVIKTEVKKPDTQKKPVTESRARTLFPDLPTLEMKAKAMAGLILRGYSQLEIKRLEYFLAHRFAGKIDKEVFQMVLDRPYNQGGVGLWRQKAEKIADQVEEIISEEGALAAIYKKLEKEPTAPLMSEVENIRKWILEDFRSKLSPLQAERLNEIIAERIRHIITPDNFRRILDLGKEKGGVGFKTRTSFQIADRMEAILGGGGAESASSLAAAG
ncbi:ATP-binding cassette domain-containing protein [Candidatus Wolfebacteria bacterium]|nr:ATP-binding cassette domain-containing protein [Candidatus Wolfebacteria bacterium]